MHPAEVLVHQADLIARLTHPMTRRVWRSQLETDRLNHASNEAEDEIARGNAAAMVYTLGKAVETASAFAVTAEMSSLVQHSSSQLSVIDRMDRRLAPTRAGIAHFDTPLRFTDVRGKTLLISWLVWGPALVREQRHDAGEPVEATTVWAYNDHYEAPDVIAKQMLADTSIAFIRDVIGRWGLIGAEIVQDGMRVGPQYVAPTPEKAAEVIADGDMPTAYTSVPRLVHAFWLLVGQTISRAYDADLDRPTRKRAQRAGLPSRVTVIELRRTEGSRSEDESLVEWSHRWVTRGHWRNQPVSDRHPLAQELEPGKWVARIWIAPFVKGPAGKPLVISEKVYAFKR